MSLYALKVQPRSTYRSIQALGIRTLCSTNIEIEGLPKIEGLSGGAVAIYADTALHPYWCGSNNILLCRKRHSAKSEGKKQSYKSHVVGNIFYKDNIFRYVFKENDYICSQKLNP